MHSVKIIEDYVPEGADSAIAMHTVQQRPTIWSKIRDKWRERRTNVREGATHGHREAARVDPGALGAIRKKIDNTLLSTMILGPSGCGKTFLLNELLEETCPVMPSEGTASAPASVTPTDMLAHRDSLSNPEIYGSAVHEIVRPSSAFFRGLDDQRERSARNLIRDAVRRKDGMGVTLDDAHSFLLPQGLHQWASPAIVVRHGVVPECIVRYPTEAELRKALFRLHELESGAKKLEYYEYEALKLNYEQVLGVSRRDIDPLLTCSPESLPLPGKLRAKLGKRFRFVGLGMDLTCDRIFIRDTVRNIIKELGCFVEELIVRFPSTLLENNIEVTLADSHNLYTPNRAVVMSHLGRANYVLLAFDKRGLTEDTRILLKRSLFLSHLINDRANSYRTRRMLFMDMLESRAHEDEHVPSKSLLDASRKVCEAQMQHQWRSFLLEALAEPYRGPHAQTETELCEIAKEMRIIHLQPLLFASLSLNPENVIPSAVFEGQSLEELKSSTQIPAVVHMIQNMQLSLCAQVLRSGENLVSTSPTRLHGSARYPLSPRTGKRSQRSASVRQDKATASIRRITGKLRDTVSKWRRELHESSERMGEVLRARAQECSTQAYRQYPEFRKRFLTTEEKCREMLNPEYNGERMGVNMSMWICGKLIEQVPVLWESSFRDLVQRRLDELVHLSADLLNELSIISHFNPPPAHKQYCAQLGKLFRGDSDESMIARFEMLRREFEQDTNTIVASACKNALKKNVLRRSRSVCGVMQYQKLVYDHLPQVSMEAASEIQKKLGALVRRCSAGLGQLEEQLDKAYQVDVRTFASGLPTGREDMDTELGELFIQRKRPTAKRARDVARYDAGAGMHVFSNQRWRFRFGSQGATLMTRFQAQIGECGLRTETITGDGNNQFRTMAYLVYGSEEAHSMVRLLVMDELLKRPGAYDRQVGDNVQAYVCRMAKDGVLGDHVTLSAMSSVYNADIMVFSPLFLRPLIIESGSRKNVNVYPIAYVSADRFLPLVSVNAPSAVGTSPDSVDMDTPGFTPDGREDVETPGYEVVEVKGDAMEGVEEHAKRTERAESDSEPKYDSKAEAACEEDSMDMEAEEEDASAVSLPQFPSPSPTRRPSAPRSLDSLMDVQRMGQQQGSAGAPPSRAQRDTFESAWGLASLSGSDAAAKELSAPSRTTWPVASSEYSSSTSDSEKEAGRSVTASSMDVEGAFSAPSSLSSRLRDEAVARKRSFYLGHLLPTTPPLAPVGTKRALPSAFGASKIADHQVAKRQKFEEQEPVWNSRVLQPLLDLCIRTITDNVDMLPPLEGCLPEELLQSIATNLIEHGKLNDAVLERLLDSSITTLDLSHCRTITNRSCGLIADACPMITSISLSYCSHITDDGIVAIANSCPYLRSINLESCITIGDRALVELASQCKRLEAVNLAGCHKVTNEGIAILQSCTNIQSLNLKRCSQITDPVFEALGHSLQALDLSECEQLTDSAVIQVARRSSDNLQTLKLSGKNITDASLQTVADECTQLRELELVGCERISDAAIYTLARMCTQLQVLNLTRCKNITANAFRMAADHNVSYHLQRGMFNLQRLDLTHCLSVTDEALRSISYLCPNLLELNLTQCEVITDSGLLHIAERVRSLRRIVLAKCLGVSDKAVSKLAQQCSDLQSVVLRQCNVTNDAVKQIARHCPKLKELDLTACEGVTDETVSLFSQSFSELESLCLEELSDLTGNSIGSLADGCSKLHTLKLAYCNVTDRALQRLARGCPRMTTLDLSYCNRLSLDSISKSLALWTDLRTLVLRGFNHVSDSFPSHPKLETIRLAFSKGVEDGCLMAIAEGCPRLQHLDIAWCSKVTGNGIGRLVRGCPLMSTLNLRQCTNVSPRIAGFIATRGITVYR